MLRLFNTRYRINVTANIGFVKLVNLHFKIINNEQTIAKCSIKNIIIRMNLYILFI